MRRAQGSRSRAVSVVVVGLEQRQAPLDLFEQVALADDALPKALAALRDRANLAEAVIVSTCQRVEVYAVVDRFHQGVAEIRETLADLAGVPASRLEEHANVRFDDEVADHLFSVASGLESAVLGESEVLGQVRRAWERSHRADASGPVLSALFRHAVEAGKRVRSETAIARGVTSMSHGAVALAARHAGGDLGGRVAVVIGAGGMGSGVVAALTGASGSGWGAPRHITIVNRTPARARAHLESVPPGFGGTIATAELSELASVLASADVVFTTVASTVPVVGLDAVAPAVEAGGGARSMVVVDLGVPRNVEPEVAGLGGVTLLDIDDLRRSVDQALSGRQAEVDQARQIVSGELDRYREAARARGAAPVISALRARAESARQTELDRQRAKRSDLTDEQWDQVDEVTRAMVASFLHEPTVALKEAAGTPRGERLVEALRALFSF